MIDLAIDTSVGGTWDVYFVDGPSGIELATVEAEDEVAQRVGVATKTHLGEYVYDTDEGLPWQGEILIKSPDIPRVTDRIRALWASIDGVTEIFSLQLTPNYTTRHLAVDGEINTIFGPATIGPVL